MFREMRRKKQILSPEASIAVLEKGTSGVLAVHGDDNYPYTVPLSYVYKDSKIYFHCAKTGHKIDSIKRNNKVSFCVIDKDSIIPEEFTTYFRSVIVFGKARILEDESEIISALVNLINRYSPGLEYKGLNEVNSQINHLLIVEIEIDNMTGKEAIELVK